MVKFDYTRIVERLYPQNKCPLVKVIGALPIVVGDKIQENKCWIAGGFIRRWYNNIAQSSDVDLFFNDSYTFDLICGELNKITTIPVKVSKFNNTYTIKINDTWIIQIQAIKHQFYQNVETLLDSFDFTICQFVYDGFNIIATENAIIDCQRKRLVPHKITYGVSSLRRIIKYTSQGYYMCGGAATEFLNQIASNPTSIHSDPTSIHSDIISVD